MPDQVQIIIKKYDSTVFNMSLSESEGEKLIQQLNDTKDELAAHEYHRRMLQEEENDD